MSSTHPAELRKTPLHALHVTSGARMVDFAGWDMPVEYSGITDEHMAVRTRAGLFDVSHMGELELAGSDALSFVQTVTTNDASRLSIGQAQYSVLATPEGTVIDDVLVYRLAEDHYMLVANAANVAKDWAWIKSQAAVAGGDVALVNASARYALLAIQGPEATGVAQQLTSVDLSTIKYYWFATGEVASVRATISRTGYTGEDGFELFVPPADAPRVWRALVEAGKRVDIRPCGLGARDTLRLEACMRLCGNDMDETTTVLEAGLGWIVGWKKDRFVGDAALRAQKAGGLTRKIVAFEMIDRGIARHGYPVVLNGAACGVVTSGTQTPFLKKAIGLAMVPMELSAEGSRLDIDIRGRACAATIVREPFYKRTR
jgi:aminomethyltransferase